MYKDKEFKKSSFSPAQIDASCVTVAMNEHGVAVRDTKDPDNTTLIYTNKEWDAFIKGVKAGEFDL